MFRSSSANNFQGLEVPNRLRIQQIDRRLQNLDRKSLQRYRYANKASHRLNGIQEKVQVQQLLFSKKMALLTEELERIDHTAKEEKKRHDARFQQLKLGEQDMQQIQEWKGLEDIVDLDLSRQLGGRKEQQSQGISITTATTDKVEKLQQQIEGMHDMFQTEEEQRNQLYAKLVEDIGQQIRQMHGQLKAEREQSKRQLQKIKMKVYDMKQSTEQRLEEESRSRIKTQEDFTRLLEETCLKLENQILAKEA